MECVAVCPARGALEVKVTKSRRLGPRAIAAAIAILFLGIVVAAQMSGHWQTDLSEDLYRTLVLHAADTGHPM
jgi:hypothetical protein